MRDMRRDADCGSCASAAGTASDCRYQITPYNYRIPHSSGSRALRGSSLCCFLRDISLGLTLSVMSELTKRGSKKKGASQVSVPDVVRV